MLELLYSPYLSAILALLGGVVLLSIRSAAKNSELRGDFRGAAFYLLLSAAIDLGHLGLIYFYGISDADKYLSALHVLLAIFGVIRTIVGSSVWVLRGRRGVHTPKIVRDAIDGVLYVVAATVVLHAFTRIDLTSLVATSAALSVVIGLALQETLGNLFAGLSLQLEHPFQVGDWVTVNEFTGRVAQVAWRATKIETLRREQVSIPNGAIAKANVVNYSRHGAIARDLTVGVAYACPPNRVKAVIHDVLATSPEVLATPPPRVRTLRYDDSAVIYELRYSVKHFDQWETAADAILSTLWYRLKREGMDIPYPQIETRPAKLAETASAEAAAQGDTAELLEAVDFLKPLGQDGRTQLAGLTTREHYGNHEVIIRTGEVGETLYLVAAGQVAVKAKVGDKEQQVATLKRGQFFGEMSLLTGEPRSATVVATGDATLVAMSRAAFGQVLASHSSVAQELADILGRRRAELDKAKAEDTSTRSKAESSRIFGRLRELFKVAED